MFATALALAAASASANDPWEADPEDDGQATLAYILPGQTQTGRDLEAAGTPDQDWVWFSTVPNHSYEARAIGGTHWSASPVSSGSKLERLDSSLVTQHVGTDEGLGSIRGHFIRFIASGPAALNYLRVTGTAGHGPTPYTLELYDTTYALPRWNNSGTQFTVLILQNTRPTMVPTIVYFYDAAGTMVHQETLAIQANRVTVLNTATIPALAGGNGSALIAQNGGRGALAGKAVALEPSTGFTFDTAVTPVMP
jgi:hypothetical protein